ncbi:MULTISPECIES: hypothetical protein [Leptolyngbya]|uniref:hypothetical protein n=1 Tax=Leptolyngbya TaxID=47251 RepID=UPI001681FBDE|nr:hypothetical protein [Leptolyngbya sp. FACHB-1624]MBD1859950.1 hypothetical protein [Leptolyngbya sp. FACHB-1624]
MQTQSEHLTSEAAQALIATLPEKIRLGLLTCAAQLDYPVEAVIEMAISGFLDEDAVNFPSCNPVDVDFGRPDIRKSA